MRPQPLPGQAKSSSGSSVPEVVVVTRAQVVKGWFRSSDEGAEALGASLHVRLGPKIRWKNAGCSLATGELVETCLTPQPHCPLDMHRGTETDPRLLATRNATLRRL